ncbi:MAG: hypothetical protein SWK76_08180 [Actinomycetota bacterium]|nr:hypothetical protein [Actinomycetota bacterium]
MVTYKVSPALEDGYTPTVEYTYCPNGDLGSEGYYSDWSWQYNEPSGLYGSNHYTYDDLGRVTEEYLGSPSGETQDARTSNIYTYDAEVADGFRGVMKENDSFSYEYSPGNSLKPTEYTRTEGKRR